MQTEFLFFYTLLDGEKRLTTFLNGIKKELDLAKEKNRAYNAELWSKQHVGVSMVVRDMISAALEGNLAYDEYEEATKMSLFYAYSFLVSKREEIPSAGPEELVKIIESIFPHLKGVFIHYRTYREYNIDSDYIRKGYNDLAMNKEAVFNSLYPFEKKSEVNILNYIKTSNILTSYFKNEENKDNVTLYTTDVEDYRYARSKELGYDKIAVGTPKGSRISNNVFDLLVLRPEIDYSILPTRMTHHKKERWIIRDSVNYVRPGGKILLFIPAYRVHRELAKSLLKTCKIIDIKNFHEKTAEMVILAEKREEKIDSIDPEMYTKLMDIPSKYKEYKNVFVEPFVKEDSKRKLEVSLFKGTKLSVEEIKAVLDESPCMDMMFNDIFSLSRKEVHQEPLIPFTSGQTGLVLTSGALDGVVEEDLNSFHAIKGRVVKHIERSIEEVSEENERRVSEVITNRVQINIITPEGELKSLI